MNKKQEDALTETISEIIYELVQQADEFSIDRDIYIMTAIDTILDLICAATFEYLEVEKERTEAAKVDTPSRED